MLQREANLHENEKAYGRGRFSCRWLLVLLSVVSSALSKQFDVVGPLIGRGRPVRYR